MSKRVTKSPRPPRVDLRSRWRIELKPPGGGTWTLVGTTGTRDQATRWLLRFVGPGGVRIRRPAAARTKSIALDEGLLWGGNVGMVTAGTCTAIAASTGGGSRSTWRARASGAP